MGFLIAVLRPMHVQLFHMWYRMAEFKKAVKNETAIPEFTVNNGHRFLPEWESWVRDQGSRSILKRGVLRRGGQVQSCDVFT